MTSTMNIVEEISENQIEIALKKRCSAINFFNEWSMSCLMMSPIIDELAEKFSEKIKFSKINIEENEKLIKKFNLYAIPSLIVFKEGKEACRLCGNLTAEQIEERISELLK